MNKRFLIPFLVGVAIPLIAAQPKIGTRAVILEKDGTGTNTTIITGKSLAATNIIDVYNAKFWGAVGDGVTDDTASVQSMLSARTTNRVFFPAGRYIVGPLMLTNTTVVGELGTVLVRKAGTSNGTVYCYGNVRFEGITFDGNRQNQTGWQANGVKDEALVRITNTAHSATLVNCTLSNSTITMIYTTGGLTVRNSTFINPPTKDTSVTNVPVFIYGISEGTNRAVVEVSDSSFICAITNLANRYTNAGGILLSEALDGTLNKFDFICERNRFIGVGMNAQGNVVGAIHAYNGVSSARIVGNTIIAYSGGGILLERSGNALIADNQLYDGYDANDLNSWGILVDPKSRNGASVFTGDRQGETHKNVIVRNNIVDGVNRYGIRMHTEDGLIFGNTVLNVTTNTEGSAAGIYADAPRVKIVNNTVRDCQVAHIQAAHLLSFSGVIANGSSIITNLTGNWTNLVVGDLVVGQTEWITGVRITSIDWTNAFFTVNQPSTVTATNTFVSPIEGLLISGNSVGSDVTTNAGHGISLFGQIWNSKVTHNTAVFKRLTGNYGVAVSGSRNEVRNTLIERVNIGVVLASDANHTTVDGVSCSSITNTLVYLTAGSTNSLISNLDSSSTTPLIAEAGADYIVTSFKPAGVGIGTTTPGEDLSIAGNVAIGSDTSSGYRLFVAGGIRCTSYIYYSNPFELIDGSGAGYGLTSTASDGISFLSNDATKPRMQIFTNGNVAINTNAPVSKLHVHGVTTSSDGFASYSTNRVVIAASGYTNTMTVGSVAVNVDVYFTMTTATLSDSDGNTLVTYAADSGNVYAHMKPGWRLVGTVMAGTAIAH